MDESGSAGGAAISAPRCGDEGLRRHFDRLPRPLRFLVVGAAGLLTDIAAFTVIIGMGNHPLAARLASLAMATLVTWRLNRALTFAPSGRRQSEEALRYALVTTVAQGTNYAVFAALFVSVLAAAPRMALLAGAAAGATLSYTGHLIFSFAKRCAACPPASPEPEGRLAL